MTSCLDDEMVGIEVEDFAGSPYLVDFNIIPNAQGFTPVGLNIGTTPDEEVMFTLTVNLSSAWQLDSDLTVNVAIDEAVVNDYITDALADTDIRNDGYELLDPSLWRIASTSVVIPAGEREASLDIYVKTASIALTDSMMVAVSITGADNSKVGISGNYGSQLVKVGVKNMFAGKYEVLDALWLYGGSSDYSSSCYGNFDFGTMTATMCNVDYIYPYWGYIAQLDVDVANPQTIDGHANAFAVTVEVWRDGTQFNCVQDDTYDGGVWNYVYLDDDGLWNFVLAYVLTTGSGGHIGTIHYRSLPE